MCKWEVVTFIQCWHSSAEQASHYIFCVTRQEMWCFGSGFYWTSCLVGTRGSLPRVKWPECEADLSSLPSVKVKNAWSSTSTVLYVFKVWCLYRGMTREWRRTWMNVISFQKFSAIQDFRILYWMTSVLLPSHIHMVILLVLEMRKCSSTEIWSSLLGWYSYYISC
jgi:hypothetical protein